jgi:hypothetical protein
MTDILYKFIADNEIDASTASVQLASIGRQWCEISQQMQPQTVYVRASIVGIESQIDFVMGSQYLDDLSCLAKVTYEDKLEAREMYG